MKIFLMLSSRIHCGIQKILSIFFPSHCISCEKIISKEALFCLDCWQKLQFISEPKCQICSYPFEVEIKFLQPLCSRCLVKKPSFDSVITIFRYNEILRKAIGDLKYRDQTFLAKKFAGILAKKIKSEIEDCDILCVAPLHINRLRKRKFNQVAIIARLLCANPLSLRCSAIEFIPDLLWRVVDTIPQVQLRKKQREKNLKKVFLVNKKYRELVKGKKILLLDDVMTTGATLENCAKVLKKCGAKKVIVAVIAKTIFS